MTIPHQKMTLGQVVSALKNFASTDRARYQLCNYLHEIDGGEERYVATDGRKMIIIARDSAEEKMREIVEFPRTRVDCSFPVFSAIVTGFEATERAEASLAGWQPFSRCLFRRSGTVYCPEGWHVSYGQLNIGNSTCVFKTPDVGHIYRALRLLAGKYDQLRVTLEADTRSGTVRINAALPDGWRCSIYIKGLDIGDQSEAIDLLSNEPARLADHWDAFAREKRRQKALSAQEALVIL